MWFFIRSLKNLLCGVISFGGGGRPFNNDGHSSDTSVYDGQLAYAGLVGLVRV